MNENDNSCGIKKSEKTIKIRRIIYDEEWHPDETHEECLSRIRKQKIKCILDLIKKNEL